jgi:hypothetical protein
MTWIQTYSGVAFDLAAPTADMVHPIDLGHSLGRLQRYTGHAHWFYSVAEHCCHVHDHLRETGASEQLAFAGLLHDAPEAYVGDLSRPLKEALGHSSTPMIAFRNLEMGVARAVCERFGLPWPLLYDPKVREVDHRILADEADELLDAPPRPWNHHPAGPLGIVLGFWEPGWATAEWLRRLYDHTGS